MLCLLIAWLGLGGPAMQLAPEDLPGTLRYHSRSGHWLDVDSAAAPATQCIFVGRTPGKYVGLGGRVIRERRRWPR